MIILIILFIMSIVLLYHYIAIKKESYWQCTNSKIIKKSIYLGFRLFLLIEFIVFCSLFWAYFHFILTEIWPPVGIVKCNPYSLPLLNTCLLLRSALRVTVYHHYILIAVHTKWRNMYYIVITIVLGLVFLIFQYEEYKYHLLYSLSDGVFGSVFYSLTGFHGIHVMLGIIILGVALSLNSYAIHNRHIGILAAIWYWHFVDVIWILLYIFVYVN